IGGVDIYQDEAEEDDEIEDDETEDEIPQEDIKEMELIEDDDDDDDESIDYDDITADDDKIQVIIPSQVIPIIKFSFFENGTLNELFWPNNLEYLVLTTLQDIMKKLVPLVSSSLYSNADSKWADDSLKAETIRTYEKNKHNTILNQEETGEVSSSGVSLSGSQSNATTNTLIDTNLGKISSVKTISDTSLQKNDTDQWSDIPMYEDNAFTEEDKEELNDGSNVAPSGINQLTSSVTSELHLVSSTIESNTSELLFNLSSTVDYSSPNDDTSDNFTLRLLKQLNLTEDSLISDEELAKIPYYTSREKWRNLKVENLKKPISFSYSVVKTNFWGWHISLDIVVDGGISDDWIKVSLVLRISGKNIKWKEVRIRGGIAKAWNTVMRIADKLVDLMQEIEKQWKNEKNSLLSSIIANIDKVINQLGWNIDLGNWFQSPLNGLMGNIKG
ncbi:MAG: hypothetical protein ACRC42_02125, partial [Mycoplasma sp.]